ncbi:hypothetical protein BUALT_Bualt07G0003600 [Buddleja alternifolia]|uniref:BTB/POZ domain-containing protein n=1 Tax=Buddleja alternifolia TaxID=168488 RepID=A0AAV6XDD0_9LAMI|nr:hypothetical protein BUALT_Bualt07G0003600 [Buddleja alternifolia]
MVVVMADEVWSAASVIVTPTEKVCREFIVENYSIRRKRVIDIDESIDSEQFMVGGYLWAIRFFPCGNTVDAYRKGRTSLFLSLQSDVSYCVPCLFEIHLLDQSGKGRHHGRYLFNTFPPDVTYAVFGGLHGLPFFIKQAYLEHSDYLKDDCLKIRCTIQVLTSHIPEPMPPLNKPNYYFGKHLQRENAKNADVFLKVAGERFHAHKGKLAAHSSVFRSYLLDSYRIHPIYQDDIVIPDTEPRIFKALLWFIYTSTLLEEEQETMHDSSRFIFESFMGKMLAAADQFELKRLKEIYESRMCERVSVESVAYLLHLSECCHATKLKDACLRFAAENRAAVLESNGAEYLKEACPLLFPELAGCTEKLSTSRERELDFCTKMVSVVKESLGGMFSPYAYKKLKDV